MGTMQERVLGEEVFICLKIVLIELIAMRVSRHISSELANK